MQTFITDPDPRICAMNLDSRRLNKQITEAIQIIKANLDAHYGWRRHPAVLMWHGYEHALAAYTRCMIQEWWNRGFSTHQQSAITVDWYLISLPDTGWPEWWGDEEMILTHKSNLVRKEPETYRNVFPNVPDDLEYYWPVRRYHESTR